MLYQKMLGLKSVNANDSAALTLMGTDVERIVETWHLMIIETWANVIQLGIAIWLLERQLGTVCIAPVLVAFGNLSYSYLGRKLIIGSGHWYIHEIRDIWYTPFSHWPLTEANFKSD